MIQHEFEELLEQFSQDELNEKSTMKGQFTSYITRRMEWHAIRYAAKNQMCIRDRVVAFALSCQGKFVYAQPSSLRGGPGNPSVGINLALSLIHI